MLNFNEFKREILHRTQGGATGCIVDILGFHVLYEETASFGKLSAHPELVDLDETEKAAIDQLERLPLKGASKLEQFHYVLVMQQASESLFHHLVSQRIAGHNIQAALDIFKRTTECVQKLHTQNVLHFDLKPRSTPSPNPLTDVLLTVLITGTFY